MSKRSTPADKVILDTVFQIPEGAEDVFVYNNDEFIAPEVNESDSDDEFMDYDSEEYIGVDYEDGYFDESDENTLEVPTEFYVLSQTLRRAPGGQQVVDIVINTEDIVGADNYEVRVVKV